MSSFLRALSLGMLCLAGMADMAAAAESPTAIIAKGIQKSLVPQRPKQDGILTINDNTLYVQCLNRAGMDVWRCEAAGLEGEPWLRNILTVERQEKLIALGYNPEKSFGNFVRIFPRSTPPSVLARNILDVMTQIYGADADDIAALSDWLPSQPCHPRIMAGHDRGGSIAARHWGFAQDISQGCRIVQNTNGMNYDDPHAVVPGSPPEGEVDLDARYNAAIVTQIKRLEGGQKHIWAIFEAGAPYVQCELDPDDHAIYCEAASGDAVGAPLERILTPARRQKLLDAGFEPPGKVMNFRRLYPLDRYDDAAIAHALLTVLHDAYGYGGAPGLVLKTETGKAAPL